MRFFIRTLSMAFRALRRNIMRSVLTTLGIVIGVAAVIAMMEIGQGSSQAVQKTIQSMGANNLLVQPGTATSGRMASVSDKNACRGWLCTWTTGTRSRSSSAFSTCAVVSGVISPCQASVVAHGTIKVPIWASPLASVPAQTANPS